MCFSLCFSYEKEIVSAEDSSTITITFQVSATESCATSSMDINIGDTISSFPVASKSGHIFAGWQLNGYSVDETTIFNEDSTLTPKFERKLYKYTISKPDTHYIIIGETTSSTLPYTLSETCESLENAIDLISADSSTITDGTVIINFTTITLLKDLELNIEKVQLSGTLNLSGYSINFTPASSSSNFNLTDLTLNSTSSQDFVKIKGSTTCSIVVSNVVFNSTENNGNYAIYLENPVHNLRFSNDLSFSSQYLYNFELQAENAINYKMATFDSTFNLVSPSTIPITIPFNADNKSILKSYVGSATMFEFHPNQQNFTCSVQSSMNGSEVIASTYFNILFDPNGANIIENINSSNINFRLTNQLNFPNETNYFKEHFDLIGFVGKVTYNSETWYFDKSALENIINPSLDISKIPTYFYSEIPNTTLSYFNYYKYNNSQTDLNFLATKLMLSLGQTPSYVAIWTGTEYSITLNENNGKTPYNLSGLFNSAVTLPVPTKTGHEFIGWFESLDLANEGLPENKVSLSSMPNTYPTYYAGWKVKSHTLYIKQNNGSTLKEISVEFGTQIELIDDANATLVSKTGHTFAGWYTNEELTSKLPENSTMPDENFSIYAKWTINQYTITLYFNHPSVSEQDEPFKMITRDYNTDVSAFFSTPPVTPSFEGYDFNRWCTDKDGRFARAIPEKMPAENLNLYASWTHHEHKLTIYYPAIGNYEEIPLYYGDDLPLSTPTYSGYIFNGWFADNSFTQPLTITTMPDEDLNVYAKIDEKESLNLTFESQTYTLSENKGFILPKNLEGFTIEYFVNEEWTSIAPTKKGTYDVRISKSESASYKSFLTVIKNGFTITLNSIDVSLYILIFYCVAGIEILCSIILLFIRKQRNTYLTYSIGLPFGLVSNSQFTNLVVSAVLAVFGFVLIIIQIVKLKHINNEIAKISTENKEYTPPDVSENSSISEKVEILLKKEGFESSNNNANDEIEDSEILSPEKELDDTFDYNSDKTKNDSEDDYLTFNSKKDDDFNS